MSIRRTIALIGIIVIAILLAFPLRDAVYEAVIVPIAYLLWVLRLYYRSVHQSIWWFAALLIVLVTLSRSLLPAAKFRERIRLKPRPVIGQVESLSVWMKRTERGIYFKWLVANRLGKIAHEILSQRMGGMKRSFFDPLTGPDWMPDAPVQQYLETGLKGSFADYPQTPRIFSKPVQTPLDHDMNDVIEYLESQVGNQEQGDYLFANGE
ncbi:MAG TPA: hypothetical protein VIS72_18610 [Anaerolineales bacterium]